jgi:hypothetical protein
MSLNRRAKFAHFFLEFGEDVFEFLPIKTNARCFG